MVIRNPGRAAGTARARAGNLVAALLAALGLVLLPLPAGVSSARADSGTTTETGSAVTKSGTKGTYDDFSGLKVTVEQTEHLRGQGVKVTWTGGAPTIPAGTTPLLGNFLQIMQCWGNSPDGPDPDQCEFGENPAYSVTQTSTRTVGGGFPDPLEPTERTIPFRPVRGDTVTDPTTYFTPLTTNEMDYAPTGADGAGADVFDVESAVDADYMGCGSVAKSGDTPEPCWLVVVPRGTHEPDGTVPSLGLRSSALSASNWAQRIVFRLGFDPIGSYCPIGQKEVETIGSEMASEALTAWQPTLCTEDKITFGYEQQSEDFARTQVTAPTDGSPMMAFVESPVTPAEGGSPIVHAPLALSGLVIAYNIETPDSTRQIPRLRLNARLLAKMLTTSYQYDLPGPTSQFARGDLNPKNPTSLITDPEFLALNPGFTHTVRQYEDIAVPQTSADYIATLWRWLRSDPDARNFLAGKPDPWGMTINPSALKELTPATNTTINSFPRTDPTKWVPVAEAPNFSIDSVGTNPYTNGLHDSAVRVATHAQPGYTGVLGQTTTGYTFTTNGYNGPGDAFNLGVTDAATAARYRLGTAELLNSDGQFVAPTVNSLTTAANAMKQGSTPGVLDQNPGLKTSGAYPLTTITYGAAPTGLDATTRADYAKLIRYAVGDGQQTGVGPGLLPPGYAPLTTSLREQALAAATALVKGVSPSQAAGDSDSGGSGGPDAAGGFDSSAASGGTGGAVAPSASVQPTATATATASPTASAAAGGGGSGGSGTGNAASSQGTTSGVLLGAVRWVLLTVLAVGLAGSVGGPLLIRAGMIGAGRPAAGARPWGRSTG
ncbi:hypothetical protein [Actinacidiphila yeochonensis]|uniref:hypothetical protein n=1 Tax=Actinacidiphila yeochonensis TaxID=89050 RepID=UPI00056CAFED|nr:hypothetical protein [Actinacidiphila yeochonensis]